MKSVAASSLFQELNTIVHKTKRDILPHIKAKSKHEFLPVRLQLTEERVVPNTPQQVVEMAT